MDGIILAVQSARKSDYMMLQMQDGNLIFSADNGAGEILTKYEPDAKNYLCDGNWHEIMVRNFWMGMSHSQTSSKEREDRKKQVEQNSDYRCVLVRFNLLS